MLNYTGLFADLERLFASAGRDPVSFRRLEREVERVEGSLADYCREVAGDYVARLEQRLGRPEATLSDDEVDLLRAYLGIAPRDPERDQALLADTAEVEQDLRALLALQDRPLSVKNLAGLRRLLGRMAAVLPRVRATLEERRRQEAFERAVGRAEEAPSGALDREWLLTAIRCAAAGEPVPIDG